MAKPKFKIEKVKCERCNKTFEITSFIKNKNGRYFCGCIEKIPTINPISGHENLFFAKNTGNIYLKLPGLIKVEEVGFFHCKTCNNPKITLEVYKNRRLFGEQCVYCNQIEWEKKRNNLNNWNKKWHEKQKK